MEEMTGYVTMHGHGITYKFDDYVIRVKVDDELKELIDDRKLYDLVII